MQIVAELLQYEPNEAIVDKNNQTAYEMTHTLLIQSKFIRFILAIANESNDSLKIIMLLTIIQQSLPVKAQPQQVFITFFLLIYFRKVFLFTNYTCLTHLILDLGCMTGQNLACQNLSLEWNMLLLFRIHWFKMFNV